MFLYTIKYMISYIMTARRDPLRVRYIIIGTIYCFYAMRAAYFDFLCHHRVTIL